MNRTEAKARAAALGISKDAARQYGNLNKTQTWLDAISAHEAQMQIQEAAEAQPGSDVLQTECEPPVVDEQLIQTEAILLQTSDALAADRLAFDPTVSEVITSAPTPIASEAITTSASEQTDSEVSPASAPDEIMANTVLSADRPASDASTALAPNRTVPDASSALATEQPASKALTVNPTVAEVLASAAVVPMFSDPWNEENETAELLPKMLDSADSQSMYSVSQAADVAIESDISESESDSAENLLRACQTPAPEPSTDSGEMVDICAPVYPLLLLCVAVWAMLWATGKLLIGLGLGLKLGLTHLVKQINHAMNERLEPAQQEGTGVRGAELVRAPSLQPSCPLAP